MTPRYRKLEPITQEEWDRLSEKAQWDCKVALRGPDLKGSEPMKWFTTSIIRHVMSGVMRVGGTVNADLNFLVLPDGDRSVVPKDSSIFQFDLSHFLQHIREAALWLGLPSYSIPPSQWAKIHTGGQQTPAIARVWFYAIKAEDKAQAVELERHIEMNQRGLGERIKESYFPAFEEEWKKEQDEIAAERKKFDASRAARYAAMTSIDTPTLSSYKTAQSKAQVIKDGK